MSQRPAHHTTQETHPTPSSNLFYPPGGLIIWIFIVAELMAFGIGFCFFAYERAQAREAFSEAQKLLNLPLGIANTIILLTSGLFAALGVAANHEGRNRASANWVFGSAFLGVLFLVVKAIEYREKISAGLHMDANDFFTYYWGLTGFHFIHVVLGILLLLYFGTKVRSGAPFTEPDITLETGVAYWHMCDLIWIIIFPLVYLIH